MIATSKYYWQTIFALTLVNSPKKSLVANEQKNRSVRYGNSIAQKLILGHRLPKVRDNRVRDEKGLIAREALVYIGHEVREAQSM